MTAVIIVSFFIGMVAAIMAANRPSLKKANGKPNAGGFIVAFIVLFSILGIGVAIATHMQK